MLDGSSKSTLPPCTANFDISRDSLPPPQCSHVARTGDEMLRTNTDVRRLQSRQRYS